MLLWAASSMVACGQEDSARATSSGGEFDTTTTDGTTAESVTLTTSISVGDTGTETRAGTSSSDSTSTFDTTMGETDDAGETELETDDTGEPEPAAPGQPASQLVSSGTQMSSPSYTMVYTLGQPTALQSTHSSPSYSVRGGLIGANGSPP
jgi:hypothetical protein